MGFSMLKSNHHYRSCECCNDVNTIIICPDLSVWKCINDMSIDSAKIGQLSHSGEIELDPIKVINWYKAADCFNDPNCKNCALLPDYFGGCILTKIKTGKRRCSTFESSGLRNLY